MNDPYRNVDRCAVEECHSILGAGNSRPLYNGLCFNCWMGRAPVTKEQQDANSKRAFDVYERMSGLHRGF